MLLEKQSVFYHNERTSPWDIMNILHRAKDDEIQEHSALIA